MTTLPSRSTSSAEAEDLAAAVTIDFEVLDTILAARLAGVARTGLLPNLAKLNDREVEVLTWVARGKTSAEIAQIVGLTKRTVDFHTDNARSKLGAATRTEAAIKAATGRKGKELFLPLRRALR